MAESLEELPIETKEELPLLRPALNARWAWGLPHVVATLLFGSLFLLFSLSPLRATDLWCHVLYGGWILEHRALPEEDPFMPLAEGVPITDSAWLAQVAFAKIHEVGGAEWLSNTFALVGLATFLVLARCFYLQTKRLSLMLLGVLMIVGVGWSRLLTVRPETLSALCFALLLWLLVSREPDYDSMADGKETFRWRWRIWLVTPLLFVAWANLHGSFLCGLGVLACFALGRILEVGWQQRSLVAVLGDAGVQRWLLLGEIATAATLINPYGVDLLIDAATFSRNVNLQDIVEWFPMTFTGVAGREFVLAWVVLMVVLRHSRRRVPAAHALLWALFGVASVTHVRMIGWFAPVYVITVLPHVVGFARRWWPGKQIEAGRAARTVQGSNELPPGRSWVYSLVCLLVVWICFAFSGVSQQLLGNTPRSDAQLYGDSTPLALSAYLRENPPSGQIFNPAAWGDWLVLAGPPGLKPFVTTNIHVTPAQVWRDYVRVEIARPGWENALDRYAVTTVVADKVNQPIFEAALRNSTGWVLAYEDVQAAVYVRSPAESETPEANAADEPLGDSA